MEDERFVPNMAMMRKNMPKSKIGRVLVKDIVEKVKVFAGTVTQTLNNSDEIEHKMPQKIVDRSHRLVVRLWAKSRKRRHSVVESARTREPQFTNVPAPFAKIANLAIELMVDLIEQRVLSYRVERRLELPLFTRMSVVEMSI